MQNFFSSRWSRNANSSKFNKYLYCSVQVICTILINHGLNIKYITWALLIYSGVLDNLAWDATLHMIWYIESWKTSNNFSWTLFLIKLGYIKVHRYGGKHSSQSKDCQHPYTYAMPIMHRLHWPGFRKRIALVCGKPVKSQETVFDKCWEMMRFSRDKREWGPHSLLHANFTQVQQFWGNNGKKDPEIKRKKHRLLSRNLNLSPEWKAWRATAMPLQRTKTILSICICIDRIILLKHQLTLDVFIYLFTRLLNG